MSDFEKRSKSALKGWATRRANQAAQKAAKSVQDDAEKKISKTIKKGSVGLNIFVSILAFIIGFAGMVVGFCYFTKPANDVYVSGNLEFHFLELGNKYTGDSTYIKAGDIDILIDAGSRYDSASAIANYIDDYVTDGKIEYVIATHAHEDHLAGFCNTSGNGGGIFNRFETGIIIDFPKTSKTNTGSNTLLGRYLIARDAEIEKGAVHYTALQCYNNADGAQRVYDLGNSITMEILYNYYYENTTSDENDYSVCVMFHQGDRNFLFTGDLEHNGEEKMVEYYATNHGGLPHCVLYKGGHHGSKTSSTTALLNAITPEIVCVCCCAGTSEYTDTAANQFPTQEFIDRIAPHTFKVYATSVVDNYVDMDNWTNQGTVKSLNGNIVVTSSKREVTVNCSNNNTYLKDTDWFRENRTMPAAWASMG